jgi:hypothetical protein
MRSHGWSWIRKSQVTGTRSCMPLWATNTNKHSVDITSTRPVSLVHALAVGGTLVRRGELPLPRQTLERGPAKAVSAPQQATTNRAARWRGDSISSSGCAAAAGCGAAACCAAAGCAAGCGAGAESGWGADASMGTGLEQGNRSDYLAIGTSGIPRQAVSAVDLKRSIVLAVLLLPVLPVLLKRCFSREPGQEHV